MSDPEVPPRGKLVPQDHARAESTFTRPVMTVTGNCISCNLPFGPPPPPQERSVPRLGGATTTAGDGREIPAARRGRHIKGMTLARTAQLRPAWPTHSTRRSRLLAHPVLHPRRCVCSGPLPPAGRNGRFCSSGTPAPTWAAALHTRSSAGRTHGGAGSCAGLGESFAPCAEAAQQQPRCRVHDAKCCDRCHGTGVGARSGRGPQWQGAGAPGAPAESDLR